MEKINVLFLAEELRVGGAESYFYKIENNINREKINFYSMVVNGKEINSISHKEFMSFYTFSPINRIKNIKNKVLENKIDVIHANSLQLAFAAAAVKKILKKKRNIKIMYTKHNLTSLEKISKKIYAKFLNKNIDLINPICNIEKNYLISIGVKENKIKTIYNGTKIEDFNFNKSKENNKEYSVGILARLSPEKQHKLFIEIAEIVTKEISNVTFYIGGDGPEKNNIIALINEKKLNNKIKMLGTVKASDFLKKMDYVMLVSNREVLPMSIIEAMASGDIVIARNVGGVKELITEETGFIIDSDNPKSYSNLLISLLKNDFNQEKANKAKIYAQKSFSLEIMLQNIENQYKELYIKSKN